MIIGMYQFPIPKLGRFNENPEQESNLTPEVDSKPFGCCTQLRKHTRLKFECAHF